MTYHPTRAGWTGTFSFDLGTKLAGCSAGQFKNEEYDEPCPPNLWSNGTWKAALGPAYHQYWNERRIRRNLEFWTDPAFGKETMLEAQMDAAAIPKSARSVNPTRLKRAFEVFQAMFPERPRWRLAQGMLSGSRVHAYPNAAAIFNEAPQLRAFMLTPGGKGARGLPRLFHFFEPVPGWQTSAPKVAKAFEEAKRYLGLRTQAMVDAWYAKAHALIAQVPGSEDNLNVRHESNMLVARPGQLEVHPWIFKFLDLFGRSQLQIGVTAAQIRATAPKLATLVKR